MRSIRSSILTLLLVAWTAIESGTIALLHEQLHACGAHRHAAHDRCDDGRLDRHRHAACGHVHADVAAKSVAATPARPAGSRFAFHGSSLVGDHPNDCAICRHYQLARAGGSLAPALAPLDECSLTNFDLPASPDLVSRAILRTRGPPVGVTPS